MAGQNRWFWRDPATGAWSGPYSASVAGHGTAGAPPAQAPQGGSALPGSSVATSPATPTPSNPYPGLGPVDTAPSDGGYDPSLADAVPFGQSQSFGQTEDDDDAVNGGPGSEDYEWPSSQAPEGWYGKVSPDDSALLDKCERGVDGLTVTCEGVASRVLGLALGSRRGDAPRAPWDTTIGRAIVAQLRDQEPTTVDAGSLPDFGGGASPLSGSTLLALGALGLGVVAVVAFSKRKKRRRSSSRGRR